MLPRVWGDHCGSRGGGNGKRDGKEFDRGADGFDSPAEGSEMLCVVAQNPMAGHFEDATGSTVHHRQGLHSQVS